MKKLINYLKTLLHGIFPTLAGGCVAIDIFYIVNNIRKITVGSGWPVVYYFALATIELFLGLCLLYELGIMSLNSKNWIKYKQELYENTMDGSFDDDETSDEAADISSDCL